LGGRVWVFFHARPVDGFLYHLNILGKLLLLVVSIWRRDSTAAYSTTDY
jgi:hypothetical protein